MLSYAKIEGVLRPQWPVQYGCFFAVGPIDILPSLYHSSHTNYVFSDPLITLIRVIIDINLISGDQGIHRGILCHF